MNPQTRALICKEWSYWRRSFLASNLIAAMLTLIAVVCQRWAPYQWALDSIAIGALSFGLVAAIYLGTWTSQGECIERTTTFTGGIPISPRRISVIRLTTGIVILSAPSLVVTLFTSLALTTMHWNWIAASNGIGRAEPSLFHLITERWLVMAVTHCPVVLLFLVLSLVGMMVLIGASVAVASLLMSATGFAAHGLELPLSAVYLLPSGVLTPGVEKSMTSIFSAILVSIFLQVLCAFCFIGLHKRRRSFSSAAPCMESA